MLIARIFPCPCEARKILRNSQNIRLYYMLNHLIRCIYGIKLLVKANDDGSHFTLIDFDTKLTQHYSSLKKKLNFCHTDMMLTFQTKVQAWVPTLFMINFYTCQLSCYNFSWPFWIVNTLADTWVTEHLLQWKGWADIGGMSCMLTPSDSDHRHEKVGEDGGGGL